MQRQKQRVLFFSCPKDWACVTLSEKNAVGRKPDQLRRLVCIESFVHKRVWAALAAECTDFCLLMGVLCCSRLILGIKKSFATFCLLGQVCFFRMACATSKVIWHWLRNWNRDCEEKVKTCKSKLRANCWFDTGQWVTKHLVFGFQSEGPGFRKGYCFFTVKSVMEIRYNVLLVLATTSARILYDESLQSINLLVKINIMCTVCAICEDKLICQIWEVLYHSSLNQQHPPQS